MGENEIHVHLTPSEFTPEEHTPSCSRPEDDVGFGLAGGGYGAYGFCPECYAILWKSPEMGGDDE